MINWLISQQALLSVVLIVLLAFDRLALKKVGAAFCYKLWALLPLSLLLFNLPDAFKPTASASITHYLVLPGSGPSEAPFDWLPLYLLGVVNLAAVILFAHWQFYRRLNPQAPSRVLKHTLPKTPLPVMVSDRVTSPMLVGFLRAKVVLPASGVDDTPHQELAMIFKHEQVHYQRGDNLLNLLALALTVLFWFNPLSWFGYRRFRLLQELSCDQQVLENLPEEQRIIYAKALVRCASVARGSLYAYSHYGEKKTMLTRLNMIKQSTKSSALGKGASLLILCGLVSTLAIAKAPEKTKENNVSPVMRVEPVYPAAAAEQKVSGSVVLKFDIKADGSTANIAIVRANPARTFDRAAKEALAQWRYETSPSGAENQLVQLNFVMDESEASDEIESIKVTSQSAH